MPLREHDVIAYDTHHGWVNTIAVYMHNLPIGAVFVCPRPFLTYSADEAAVHTPERFEFQVVTKPIGVLDEGNPEAVPSRTSKDWLFVRDPDEAHTWDSSAQGYRDEGFYAFSYPTLVHRVVETDNADLAALMLEHDPESSMDDVFVQRPAAATR